MRFKKIITITLLLICLFSSVCLAYGMQKGTVAYYDHPTVVVVCGYNNYTIAEIWGGHSREGERVVGDLTAFAATEWYFANADEVRTVYVKKNRCSKDEVIRWIMDNK